MSKIVINQDFNYVSDGNDIITDLDALSDVNITAAADGQILVYNGTSNKWENADNSEITGLTALSDVTITSLADDQFLRYDSTSGEWVNETVDFTSDLDGLSDVNITSVANDQILRYDSNTNNFTNQTLNLDALSDVDTTGKNNQDVLIYNHTAGQWEPGAVALTGNFSLDDLTDVTISPNVNSGHVLYYGSTGYENTNSINITEGTRIKFNEGQIEHSAGVTWGTLLYDIYNNNANGGNFKQQLYARNSSGVTKLFSGIELDYDDRTAGQESGEISFYVASGLGVGLVTPLRLHSDLVFLGENTNIYNGWLQIENTTSTPTQYLYRNETPTTDNIEVGSTQAYGKDDGGNVVKYTQIDHVAQDITDGTEDGAVVFKTMANGTLTERMVVDPTGITVTGTVTADTLDGTVIDGGTY